MEDQHGMNEIDLMSLFKMLWNKWYVIVLSVMLCFGIAFIYAFYMIDDVYTAQSSMLVLVENEDSTIDANFRFGQNLVDTYSELAKSDLVIDQLIANLGLTYSCADIRKNMTISGVNNTIIIKLSIQHNDPELAAAIANEIAMIMKDVSSQYQGFDNIEILDVASIPTTPTGPNRILYVAIGIILGGIIGVGIIFVFEFMDTSIKSPKDIEQKLGLKLLAAIPDYDYDEGVKS
ncbi:MAG: YveK family protein [Acholeplasmataceae bacterium]